MGAVRLLPFFLVADSSVLFLPAGALVEPVLGVETVEDLLLPLLFLALFLLWDLPLGLELELPMRCYWQTKTAVRGRGVAGECLWAASAAAVVWLRGCEEYAVLLVSFGFAIFENYAFHPLFIVCCGWHRCRGCQTHQEGSK